MERKRMRAIFYQPASRHPGPCYYRGMSALMLQEVLRRAGCEISVVTPSVEDRGGQDPTAPSVREAGGRLAKRLLGSFRADPSQAPEIWITGGICPHAPDWLGLHVSRQLAIPYVLLEPQIGAGTSELATVEEKESAKNAVKEADATVTTRSLVARGLATLLDDSSRLIHLLPFLDLAPSLSASHLRSTSRNELVRQLGMPLSATCLVTDGSQEPGPSLDAWQMLALALSRIVMLDWQVVVLVRGGVEQVAHTAMRLLPSQRVHYWSDPAEDDRLRALAGSDLYVGPATDDAGLSTLLEAQATGTPVVACEGADVADRVLDGRTGRLAAPNAESLANSISFLLRHPNFRETYAQQARETTVTRHDVRAAAETLRGILYRVVSAAEPSENG